MNKAHLAFLSLAFLACGHGAADAPADMAAPGTPADMAVTADLYFKSACGHPGDKGNSLGVGKFCQRLSECKDDTNPIFKANLCTKIADPNNFFCTFGCKGDGGATQCGEMARCACDNGQCGCFPTACN